MKKMMMTKTLMALLRARRAPQLKRVERKEPMSTQSNTGKVFTANWSLWRPKWVSSLTTCKHLYSMKWWLQEYSLPFKTSVSTAFSRWSAWCMLDKPPLVWLQPYFCTTPRCKKESFMMLCTRFPRPSRKEIFLSLSTLAVPNLGIPLKPRLLATSEFLPFTASQQSSFPSASALHRCPWWISGTNTRFPSTRCRKRRVTLRISIRSGLWTRRLLRWSVVTITWRSLLACSCMHSWTTTISTHRVTTKYLGWLSQSSSVTCFPQSFCRNGPCRRTSSICCATTSPKNSPRVLVRVPSELWLPISLVASCLSWLDTDTLLKSTCWKSYPRNESRRTWNSPRTTLTRAVFVTAKQSWKETYFGTIAVIVTNGSMVLVLEWNPLPSFLGVGAVTLVSSDAVWRKPTPHLSMSRSVFLRPSRQGWTLPLLWTHSLLNPLPLRTQEARGEEKGKERGSRRRAACRLWGGPGVRRTCASRLRRSRTETQQRHSFLLRKQRLWQRWLRSRVCRLKPSFRTSLWTTCLCLLLEIPTRSSLVSTWLDNGSVTNARVRSVECWPTTVVPFLPLKMTARTRLPRGQRRMFLLKCRSKLAFSAVWCGRLTRFPPRFAILTTS